MTEQNQQVADYWSGVADRQELGFWNIPGWEKHQNLLASNTETHSWLDVLHQELKNKGIKPGNALSVGCGCGLLEREMYLKGMCKSIEGCDLSEPLLEMARNDAAKMNAPLTYFKADLNQPDFKENHYDLIVGAGVFHHVENLEGLFDNLKKALRPGGRLIMYEYVGPTRFQWTQSQINKCNEWLKKLPSQFKRKQGYPYKYVLAKQLFNIIPLAYSNIVHKLMQRWASPRFYAQFLRLKTAQIQLEEVVRPAPEQFMVTDPSEAVRASEIIPVLKNYFTIERILPQGGSLVQPIFGRTVANFIGNEEGERWAEKILEAERQVIISGELPSDFLALIAKPK